MKTKCLTCKRHIYDLDDMTEYCQVCQEQKDFCTMYKPREQYTKEIADRWDLRQQYGVSQ